MKQPNAFDERQVHSPAEAGFDHHLIKPVEHDVLMKLIADVPASR